jgi:coenzyme F420-reducing hydrogenase delta subunit
MKDMMIEDLEKRAEEVLEKLTILEMEAEEM